MENNQSNYQIEKRLIEILSSSEEFGDQAGNLSYKDSLEGLGVNSVSFIKMAVKIENEFGFEFEDEDLDVNKFTTIGSIIEYISEKQVCDKG